MNKPFNQPLDDKLRSYMQSDSQEFDCHCVLAYAKQQDNPPHKLSSVKFVLAAVLAVILILTGSFGTLALAYDGVIQIPVSSTERIKQKYNIQHFFYDNSLMVFKGKSGKLGLIDSDGKVILKDEYISITPIDAERYCVTKSVSGKLKSGIIGRTGDILCPLHYERIEFYHNPYTGENGNIGIAYHSEKQTYVLLNKDGKPYNSSEWLAVNHCGYDMVKGYKTDGKAYSFIYLDGTWEETPDTVFEQTKKQISGYDVKVLYDETSKNRALENQIHQSVVDFMIAVSKQDMDKIKALSTNNFFNDILNHRSEAIDGILGFDFSAIMQICSMYQSSEKYITYIILESAAQNYECELEIVVNDNNVLVNNITY